MVVLVVKQAVIRFALYAHRKPLTVTLTALGCVLGIALAAVILDPARLPHRHAMPLPEGGGCPELAQREPANAPLRGHRPTRSAAGSRRTQPAQPVPAINPGTTVEALHALEALRTAHARRTFFTRPETR